MGQQHIKGIKESEEITFTYNGKTHTVNAKNKITPLTSLNTYLRTMVNLRDTKVMCREGGCGACIVAVTFYHPIFKRTKTIAVNSCLVPILACHNWEIETNHGIGNKTKGYNEIQHNLAKFGGSQCGYCSGGMVMNMYALTQSKDMLSMKEIENSFGGNLCRCTGYRPILDAFKSMATDADRAKCDHISDIEDIKICPKTQKECSGTCVEVSLDSICWKLNDDMYWFQVHTVDNILELFILIGHESYRLVAGNTAKGVYPINPIPKYWIDIRNVKELTVYKVDKELIIGAAVSISDAMEIIQKLSKEKEDYWYLDNVYKHLDLVANVPVRNNGTLAGNLVMKHDHHQFPSDVFLLLTTVGATITIVKSNGSEVKKTVPEFINMDMNKCVLKQISFPPINKKTHLFKSYKIMPRAQNAHAYVNAGFLVNYEKHNKVKSCHIIFGGINPNFINAKNTEKYLIGKNLFDNDTIQGALKELTEEVKPDYVLPDATPDFRKNLARNLFYKFVLATAPQDKINAKYITGGLRLEREISRGVQIYQTNKKMYPVTQPVPKIEALIQTSGEAHYIDDKQSMVGEVFGAFVLAETIPLSKIKEVNTANALKMPGVVAYIDYTDVPGKNTFCSPPILVEDEELFCSGKVLYNGQPVGLILAESFDQAQAAADEVKITYKKSNEKPMLTIKDVLKNNVKEKIINVSSLDRTRSGTKTKHKLKGECNFNGQYHFTMETQTCICIPNDDGSYTLHSGTQQVNLVQQSAALALNIPMNKIIVVVRRVGGAFGGKLSRSALVSTTAAIAAYKVQKPVRIILPLTTNMKAIGKRYPTYAKYEVETDDKGVIQLLDVKYYQATATAGKNEQLTFHMNEDLKNGYNFETWKLNGNVVTTDMPGNSLMRAPSTTEGVAIIESIMQHIAIVTGKNDVEVRKVNLSSEFKELSQLMDAALSWAEYDKRRKSVDDFNKNNRWTKKGLGVALMNYDILIISHHSLVLSIFAVDGTVTISHGGIECGQGINTKVVQVCAYELKIPMEMITIVPTYNYLSPNNQVTGGSITSESVCWAAIQACKEILSRLQPVKEKMKNPTWKELIWQANVEEVELSAMKLCTTKFEPPYKIPGFCVSEVEVDVLTGEYLLNRVDLLEDVGSSISPQIDVGQIEGAFIMGLGNHVCENLVYGDEGQLLTNNTWTYKVPGAKDIPVDFRVKFKVDGTNPGGVFNSKTVGEPALVLSVSIPFAIRDALKSARHDSDSSDHTFLSLEGPSTVEYTLQNTLNDYKKYHM